ncbi:hypothetical protein [Streptomyces marianii]|uniref:Uncharacterized protein n=1 Tax=Streptomyces marianii TaxID=1817406 RepID=A0A5R9DZW0_9ACTN|nr:hypothetical protein [Streptomyces marianii]TLQ43198.1 hypothetical protein FEF34_08635 [Streptomyces marianii]
MLLHVCNGEQVDGMVAVLPETFTALPSTSLRKDQLRLVHRVRSIEREHLPWAETTRPNTHRGFAATPRSRRWRPDDYVTAAWWRRQ